MSQLKPEIHSNDHFIGPLDAPVTIMEYGSYQCPYCIEAQPVIVQLLETFGNQMNFGFRHFPLEAIHPLAYPTALAAEAAHLQGKFWEMHQLLIKHQDALHPEGIMGLAQMLNLDIEQFQKDMKSEALLQRINSDLESGLRSGVNGSPTFFINGIRYNGDWDFLPFKKAIDSQL